MTGTNPNAFEHLMNSQKNDSAQPPQLPDLKAAISSLGDLSKQKMSTKTALYSKCISYLDGQSKFSVELKNVLKDMLNTVKNQQSTIAAQAKQIAEFKSSNAQFPPLGSTQPNSKYSSAANAVKNKPTENLVIIKSNSDSIANLKDYAFKKLKAVQSEVDVLNVKRSNQNKTLKLFVKTPEQQETIVKRLELDTNITASKPREKIPSIFISEIEREENVTDYKEYIREQIHINHNIPMEKITVKVVINNPHRHTLSSIVNFDKVTTTAILNGGQIKIGFKICPIKRTTQVIQCIKCWKLGHRATPNPNATNPPNSTPAQPCSHLVCPFCTEAHPAEECPVRSDKSKYKCINCNGNHCSSFRNCPARRKAESELLSRCCC